MFYGPCLTFAGRSNGPCIIPHMNIVREIGPYFAYVYRGTCPRLRMIRAVPVLESGDNGNCNHVIFTHGSHLVSMYKRGSRTLPNYAEHCRTLPNTAEHYRTLPNTAEHCRTICRTLPTTVEHCRTLPNTAEYGRIRIAYAAQCY